MSVWHVIVSHLVLQYCLLHSLWHWVSWLYPLHCQMNFSKLFGFQKMVNLQKLLLKGTSQLLDLRWHFRKQCTRFISSTWAKTDRLVCFQSVFWKKLSKCFLYFSHKSLFFAMLKILSTPLPFWLQWTTLCTISKSCPILRTVFPLDLVLEKCVQTVHLFLLGNICIQFLWQLVKVPFSIMWYLHLGRNHMFSSWWAIQYFLLTMYHSYVFAEIERLFPECCPNPGTT